MFSMDVHPIPQNVTSFQFKLIGDMTLKQFIYLAGGLGLAYLLFILLAHDYPFVTWPLIVISVILGVSFAFLPIGSRPLDHWLAAFLKAIYSPTKRTWKKNGKTFQEDPLFGSRLIMYLAGLQPVATEASGRTQGSEPVSPVVRMAEIPISPAPPSPPQVLPPPELPSPEELQKTVDLARQAQNLQMKIIQTERTLSHIKTEAEKPTPIPIDYSEQVNKILANLQNLVTQASAIKQQIQSVQQPPKLQTAPQPIPPIPKEKIKIVIPPRPKQATLTLTTFPNVINGIVKDKEGNYLEGVIAVIYDKEGLPVRALKTNKLGQFSGSTPLPNGTYTLELEKDNFTFDVLQIELSGQVLPPLLITAK